MQEINFNIKGYELKLLKTNPNGELPRLTVQRWKICCVAIIILDEPEVN